MLVLLGTPVEQDVLNFIRKELAKDTAALAAGEPVSLLAKWLPSVNASSKETRRQASLIARGIGMSDSQYCRTLSALRASENILENHLHLSDYTFDYAKQPSRAMLKSLLLDPRIRLFDPDFSGLEVVEPLFSPDDFVYYERNDDGDPYADPDYISHFQTVLQALRDEKNLSVSFLTQYRTPKEAEITPHYLEYSEKDGRFRLIGSSKDRRYTINLSRITHCEAVWDGDYFPYMSAEKASLTFELEDNRKTLERVLLHFSHLEKETKRLDENQYRVTIHYDRVDENEILIRILSFGPFVRVIEPESFISLLRERISKQKMQSSSEKQD